MAKATKTEKANSYNYLQDKNGDLFLDCTQLKGRKHLRKVTSEMLTTDDFETVGPAASREEKLSKDNVKPVASKGKTEAEEGWE